MDPTVTPWYLDKGFLLLFLSPLLGFISKKFGVNLDAAEIMGLVLPIVAFIVMHKWKTKNIAEAKIAGAAAAATVTTDAKAVAELNK